MSMQSPNMRISHSPRLHAGRQSGIGLVQVMLVLLLVAATLGAGAILLQSKKAPSQALTQEQDLRWADEAIVAFAAAHSRLPCPAQLPNQDEDCSTGHNKGWLPWRSLSGASGNGPQVGPMAYMVYRGDTGNQLDLADVGNAYQPAGLDGENREIVVATDDKGEPTETREMGSINGLDLCRTLALATDATPSATLANVQARSGLPVNVAYGIAAAGPQAGTTGRLDDSNANTAAKALEAPWREWDSGYDDRVRIRTFDTVGQMLGCRMQSDHTAAAASAPAPFAMAAVTDSLPTYDVSLASMDMLAAAVTMHDTLAALQDNNVGNTNASVVAAGFAQAVAIAAVVLSAGQITDAISTMVTEAVDLVRAIATCIASLGATCWEVPIKATGLAVATVGGVVAQAVALGVKIGALVPTAEALAMTIDARDRAKKAAEEKPADLESTIKQMACDLYGNDPPTNYPDDEKHKDYKPYPYSDNPCIKLDKDGKQIPNSEKVKVDADGYPIPKRDADGKPMFSPDGVPLYESEPVFDNNPPGLDDKRDLAKTQWDALAEHSTLLFVNRITPWDDQHIKDRISPYSYDLDQSGRRYRKEVIDVFCDDVGANNGEYDLQNGNCVKVGSHQVNNPDGSISTVKNGSYDRREEKRYEFDWDKAVVEAIDKRKFAEKWVEANRRVEEAKKEAEEQQKRWDQWFVGKDGAKAIFTGMVEEKKADCAKDQTDKVNKQKCDNAEEAVTYIDTCKRHDIDPDDPGKKIIVEDTNLNATCRNRMQEKLTATKAKEQAALAQMTDQATKYSTAPAPRMAYPSGWFHHAIEIIKDGDGNPIDYKWLDSRNDDRNKEPYSWACQVDGKDAICWGERWVPYYAPEPYTGSVAPLLVTGNMEIYNKDLCRFFNGTWWNMGWGDAYKHGIYCQRYPYSRGYDDWKRAQEATELARIAYEGEDLDGDGKGDGGLKKEFDNLEAQYQALLGTDLAEPGGKNASPVSFGAETVLERADARGSVGPQPVTMP